MRHYTVKSICSELDITTHRDTHIHISCKQNGIQSKPMRFHTALAWEHDFNNKPTEMPTKQAKHQQLQEEEQKKMKQAKGEQEKSSDRGNIQSSKKKLKHTKCLKWDKSEPTIVNDRDRTIRHSYTGL